MSEVRVSDNPTGAIELELWTGSNCAGFSWPSLTHMEFATTCFPIGNLQEQLPADRPPGHGAGVACHADSAARDAQRTARKAASSVEPILRCNDDRKRGQETWR